MFKFLVTIRPLGFLYGSSGGFLSPENLVGQSGSKFPPDAPTLSGLFFSANKEQKFEEHDKLRDELYIAGPFWAFVDAEEDFYVPLPRHKVIGEDYHDEWSINNHKWHPKSSLSDSNAKQNDEGKKEESEYRWLRIDYWDDDTGVIHRDRKADAPAVAKNDKCWKSTPFLHPQMKQDERHTLEKDGLFLENAVQMRDDTCLVYLSTYRLEDGWYQFGGEGHFVEVKSIKLPDDSPVLKRLNQPIQKSFALIAPGVWGSSNLSTRYPKQQGFAESNQKIKLLTGRASPHRYRMGHGNAPEAQMAFQDRKPGRLSRGRYAVPAGTVYVVPEPLNQPWWNFSKDWFPEKGLLKKFGCGLCLPVHIEGIED